MTVLFTELCAQRLLSGVTFPTQFNGGAVQLYAGTMPIAAELPPAGTLLGTLRDQSNAAPQFVIQGSSIILDPSKVWRFVLSAVGTPGYIRITPNNSYTGSVVLTNQHNLPGITSTAQPIELNTFYATLTG